MGMDAQMKKFKFDYDKENDDLFIYDPKLKGTKSIEVGDDLVLDVDNKNRLVGVELINATKLIAFFTSKEISSADIKNLLENLRQASISVSQHKNLVKITLQLLGEKHEVVAPIIPLATQDAGPALALA